MTKSHRKEQEREGNSYVNKKTTVGVINVGISIRNCDQTLFNVVQQLAWLPFSTGSVAKGSIPWQKHLREKSELNSSTLNYVGQFCSTFKNFSDSNTAAKVFFVKHLFLRNTCNKILM